MNAPDVLPWEMFAPELRDAVKALSGQWPAQTVADCAQQWADRDRAHGRYPGTDWRALGWRDEREHTEFVDGLVDQTVALPADARTWVRQQREAAGIPNRRPLSADHALEIKYLIEQAQEHHGARTAA